MVFIAIQKHLNVSYYIIICEQGFVYRAAITEIQTQTWNLGKKITLYLKKTHTLLTNQKPPNQQVL